MSFIEATFQKTPNANKDYGFDWTDWLTGPDGSSADTIASSAWTVPAGLTAGAVAFTATQSTQYLSGGSIGQDYVVTNKITTSAGRIEERSLRIQVRSPKL